ncbi:MAG: HNH endonuclease [Clostridia bacterium]|jgi:5-methylcytosine-specific restriction endonuclease McrA
MYKNRPEYNTPEYKTFRNSVFARDGFTCQMCFGKRGVKHLEAHHIVKWSKCDGELERLRYAVDNGITLCKDCHAKVTGSEEKYEDIFRDLIKQKRREVKLKDKKAQKAISQPKMPWRPINPRLRF